MRRRLVPVRRIGEFEGCTGGRGDTTLDTAAGTQDESLRCSAAHGNGIVVVASDSPADVNEDVSGSFVDDVNAYVFGMDVSVCRDRDVSSVAVFVCVDSLAACADMSACRDRDVFVVVMVQIDSVKVCRDGAAAVKGDGRTHGTRLGAEHQGGTLLRMDGEGSFVRHGQGFSRFRGEHLRRIGLRVFLSCAGVGAGRSGACSRERVRKGCAEKNGCEGYDSEGCFAKASAAHVFVVIHLVSVCGWVRGTNERTTT